MVTAWIGKYCLGVINEALKKQIDETHAYQAAHTPMTESLHYGLAHGAFDNVSQVSMQLYLEASTTVQTAFRVPRGGFYLRAEDTRMHHFDSFVKKGMIKCRVTRDTDVYNMVQSLVKSVEEMKAAGLRSDVELKKLRKEIRKLKGPRSRLAIEGGTGVDDVDDVMEELGDGVVEEAWGEDEMGVVDECHGNTVGMWAAMLAQRQHNSY